MWLFWEHVEEYMELGIVFFLVFIQDNECTSHFWHDYVIEDRSKIRNKA